MAQVPETFSNQQSDEIPNYLPLSIVGLFFCLPLAVVGVFFGIQVKNLKTRNDPVGARRASQRARTWTIAALGVGVIFYLIATIVGLVSYSVSAGSR